MHAVLWAIVVVLAGHTAALPGPDPLCYDVSCNECQSCVGGKCEFDAALAARCESGRCTASGECQDPCEGVDCGYCGECDRGQCVATSAGTPCQSGGTCDQYGECLPPDLCKDVSCNECQSCDRRSGQCVFDQEKAILCPVPGSCTPAGECRDPCEGVDCGYCRECVGGQCKPDGSAFGSVCYTENDESGTCNTNGECQLDASPADPCDGVTCSTCHSCSNGECVVTPGAACAGGICTADGVCQDTCTAIGGYCFQAKGKTRCPSNCPNGCVKATEAKNTCAKPSECYTCI